MRLVKGEGCALIGSSLLDIDSDRSSMCENAKRKIRKVLVLSLRLRYRRICGAGSDDEKHAFS